MDFDSMKRLLLLFGLLLAPSIAFAQCNGVFPAQTVCGTVAGGPPGQIPFSVFGGPTGATGAIQTNNGSGGFGNIPLTNNPSQFLNGNGAFSVPSGSSTLPGRLSLISGASVMATSVAGATTVYYVSYNGINVPIYNGTNDGGYPICTLGTVGACQQSVALGSAWTANSNWDWYEILNGGIATLCTGPAWASRTTQLTQFNGRNTNTALMNCQINNSTTIAVPANQATYVGSMRTGLAGQVSVIFGSSGAGGIAASFGLWNANNRVSVRTKINDTNVNVPYTLSTPIRPAQNSANNSASFISGLAEDGFSCEYDNVVQLLAINANFAIGCSLDSTTVMDQKKISLTPTAGIFIPVTVKGAYNPTTGWHTLSAVENGDGTNANQSSGGPNEAFTFEWDW